MNAPESPQRRWNLFGQLEAFAAAPGWPGRLLLAAITLFMLWAGLDPKGYRFRNEVDWVENGGGLRFGRFGRVETEPFLSREQAATLNAQGFAVELTFEPPRKWDSGFRVLASFHSGTDASQLIIGQWREHLILMNGDDYSHVRRTPRITADTTPFLPGPLTLVINRTTNRTSLFLNGELISASPKLQLALPATPDPGRLTLGNTVNASLPWRGVIREFALAGRPLDAAEIRARAKMPTNAPQPPRDELLFYHFAQGSGVTVVNQGSLPAPLTIPTRLYALGHRFLAGSLAAATPRNLLAIDSIVNFIGFMPFAAVIVILLHAARSGPLRAVLLATLASLLLSFTIELAQAWMPPRDSSLRDLLLNTAGGCLGAWGWILARKWWRRLLPK